MMNEQKVLKKLDITDFRHLTKDKVIIMVLIMINIASLVCL